MKVTRVVAALVGTSALLVAGALPAMATTTPATGATAFTADTSQGGNKAPLRRVAPRGFLIGAPAAGGGHHLEQDYPDPFTNDRGLRKVLAKEFSSITPENQLKWEFVHPEPDVFNFGPADAIVDFARRNGQGVRGHTLFWHSQNPAWLTEGTFTKDELRSILKTHVKKVVGRYKGKIYQWDVVNEIFDENGQYRTADNLWLRELGPEIVFDVFRWAHEADPHAKLFLNDFGAESINARSDAYLKLAQDLRAAGLRVDGFAVQAHLSLEFPFPADLAANLKRFEEAGFETGVTELDVRIPLTNGAATDEQLQTQADYYRQTLEACLSVKRCKSFTVWGTSNKYSWVPVFFEGQGEATIFTDDFKPKPAYKALHKTLVKAGRR